MMSMSSILLQFLAVATLLSLLLSSVAAQDDACNVCDCLDLGPGSYLVYCEDPLSAFPINFPSQTTYLYMVDIGLTNIPPFALDNLANLLILNLGSNQITSISVNAFAGLVSLQELILLNNQIASIDDFAFQDLQNLVSLSLQSNLLTELRPNMFFGMNSLQQILLNRNQIVEIAPNSFYHIPAIQQIILNENFLTTLPDGLFFDLNDLTTLTLEDNLFETAPGSTYVVDIVDDQLILNACPPFCWTCDDEFTCSVNFTCPISELLPCYFDECEYEDCYMVIHINDAFQCTDLVKADYTLVSENVHPEYDGSCGTQTVCQDSIPIGRRVCWFRLTSSLVSVSV